jgi:3-oxoacyl-[acyl-carrier protein] reductase
MEAPYKFLNPNPLVGKYTIAKGTMITLTKATAVEYASRCIRIDAVDPGFVKAPSKYEKKEEAATLAPLGRMAEPDEVASLVAFLNNEKEIGYITGQVWALDGGPLAVRRSWLEPRSLFGL